MASVNDIISFEVLRTIRKRTFWLATLLPPILIIVIFTITHASSNSASSASVQQSISITKNSKIAVLDETGLVSKQLLKKEHISTVPTESGGINSVKANSLTAFIYYPKNVFKTGIQIYAQDKGITNATPYNALATGLLKNSAVGIASVATHNTQVVELLQSSPSVANTTYKNGKQTNELANLVAPGIFMVSFLAILVLQSYIMVTSTTEEKENRAAEIILTSIKSSRLIVGKILSLFILGMIQLLAIIIPLLVGYAVFRHHISLPAGISLRHLPLNPKAITFGALFFVGGLVLFTSVLVGVGSLFPSAQDAGRYVGFSIVSAFLPIYTIGYIISSTHTVVVNVFTYFPLTAPTTVLVRNAIGDISVKQTLISLAIVVISAVLAIIFAMKAYRYSAMEYGRRVSIKEVLR